jgi:uncharacterized membrane protein
VLARHLSRGALAGILLGAALLRWANIGRESLWVDEIWSLMDATMHRAVYQPAVQTARQVAEEYLAWQPLDLPALAGVVSNDIHPPLYFILLNLWSGVFGTNETAVRSLSAGASLLMLLPIYQLGLTLGDRKTAVCATFVAAVSPAQLYYAQEARMYALAALCGTLSCLAFWKMLFGRRPALWAAGS